MDKCCCHNPCCPAPVPAEPIDFYAQYGTSYNGASGTYVSFFPVFQEGVGIRLENDTTISLKPGYLYLIDFIFLGTAEADGYMQILPYINGSPPVCSIHFLHLPEQNATLPLQAVSQQMRPSLLKYSCHSVSPIPQSQGILI